MAQKIKKKFIDQELIDQIDLVESGLAQEISDRESADSALEASITDLEGVVQGNFDLQQSDIDGLRSDVDALSANDTALDGKIETEKARIDAILLASDADKDSFAEIVNLINSVDTENDQAFASYVLSNDAALAQEVSDRQLADDVIKEYKPDQILYVAKNGLDTNVGSDQLPFLTLSAALSSITDASPSKRYVIKVLPGTYAETSIPLKANVFVVGDGQKESVRITGAVSMDSSFSGNGDHRSGFKNVVLLSAADFNWQTVTSAAGKLYFSEVVFGSTVNMYGHNNAIAQAQFDSCIIFGALTISGVNVGIFTNNVCYSDITLNQHPNGGMVSTISATGGFCGGTFRLNSTDNDFNRRSSAFLRNFWSENLISDGAVSYADVDLVSGSKQGAQKLNGGQVIALNPVVSHDLTTQMIVPRNTNAHNMGDWGKQWFWNFGYVHASTGTDLFLISYGSSYGADDSGKSIGIYADGAGLQENVDGGNIQLNTSATSGTGVRGKIILDAKEIDATDKNITNLADGVDPKDAVNKSQLDAVAASAVQFSKGSQVVGSELSYIDLDREYTSLLTVAVGRILVHEDQDFTVSVVDGKTRITWIGSLVNPGGEEAIETGDKVFFLGIY